MSHLVVPYAPEHRGGVATLFDGHYGGGPEAWGEELSRRFDHPYQASTARRFVVLLDGEVGAFQSYLRWPYRFGGDEVDGFQSGHSLVGSALRGAGVFRTLLRESVPHLPDDALVIGFPNPASLPAFVKEGWSVPGDVAWSVKRARSAVRSRKIGLTFHRGGAVVDALDGLLPLPGVQLANEMDFLQWRYGSWLPERSHGAARVEVGADTVGVEVRFEARRRVPTAVLGGVRSTDSSPRLLAMALAAVARSLLRRGHPLISAATLNGEHQPPAMSEALSLAGFRPIQRSFPMITWGTVAAGSSEPWNVTRADVDTW